MDHPGNNAESTFAEALEASLNFKKPEQGELLKGTIVSISGEDVFITYGGPTEAVIAAEEVAGMQVGDTVEATVIQTGPELRVSRRALQRKASFDVLRGVYESGVYVEGKVTGRNKGGYDVQVSGMRAFCPLSQIDLGKIANPDEHLGQTYEFKIIELSDDGRKFVVSRAAVIKEEMASKAEETRGRLEEGAVFTGRVRSLVSFGAFVDIGGIEGLLHVSEMGRRRINDPKEYVNVGDEIQVKVIRIENDGKRISLSTKDFEEDPWEDVEERYPVGATFTGTIVRKTDFGLFVELEQGVDGLVHLSQLPLGVQPGDSEVEIGTEITGWVKEVDASRRRISLAMREVATEDPWEYALMKYPTGRILDAAVERASGPGVFVELEPGLTGLVPMSELDLAPGTDAARHFAPGQTMRVKVLSVDPVRRRISLTQDSGDEADSQEVARYGEKNDPLGKSALAIALERAFDKKS